MNLLDKQKQKGLAILPVLFLLFSCEEPSEIGLNINPDQGAISTHFVELPVETAQLKIDSVRSGLIRVLTQTPQGVPEESYRTPAYIGRINDPVFGPLAASLYTNIGTPATTIPTVAANAAVDSVVLRLGYGKEFLGDDISATQRLRVFRFAEAIEPTSLSDTIRNYNYQIFNSEPLASQIGEISFDTASVESSTLGIHLDKSFGREILDQIIEDDSATVGDQQKFNDLIGGLALVPGEENTFINNYLILSSRIDLYYGGKSIPISFPFQPEDRQLQEVGSQFYLQYPTYFGLETDFSGTPLAEAAGAGNRESFQTPDNQRYFRAGVGLVPKITFPAFEDFLNSDTLGNYIINQLVLEIDSVTGGESNSLIPRQVHFYFADENNARINGVITGANGGVPLTIGTAVINEQDTVLRYTSTTAASGADLLFLGLNQYIETRDENYLRGVLGNPPSSQNSLFKFVADPEKIKLRIYYTTIENENN